MSIGMEGENGKMENTDARRCNMDYSKITRE